ncbi:MAG: hypothetical protein ACREID_03975 [Planctomycetota bacterium]
MPVDPIARNASSSRRDFLRLAAAVGLLGPAGAGCRRSVPPARPRHPLPAPSPLGPEYLARGLVAMSDAHRRGWVQGHLGAAVVASYYFCRENGLDERTSRALRAQVDAFIERRRPDFPSANPGGGAADPAPIVEQLDRDIPRLRSGGHNAIYASLALRALRDLPEFATPSVVEGIRRLLEVYAATARPVAESRHNLEHPLPPYRGAQDIAAVTLRATLRPWSHVMEVGASGVVHWVTHAEALVTLDELGYGDVARRGHAAHQLQINRPVEGDETPAPERAPVDWLGPEYWESDAPRRVLGDTWLFGHSFKLPYSLFRLLRCTDDPSLRSDCLARATKLSIPFE